MNPFQTFNQKGLPSLISHQESVEAGDLIEEVYDRFRANGCDFMAILDENRYVGSVSRSETLSLLSGRYGFPLFARKPVEEHLCKELLCLNDSLSIHEVLDQALNSRDENEFYHDVALISEERHFLGMIPAHSLVQVQWGLMKENTEQIQCQRQALQYRTREMQTNLDELQASRSRWASLFNENPLATVIADENGVVETVNARCVSLFGDLPQGSNLATVIAAKERDSFEAAIRKSRQEGSRVISKEYHLSDDAPGQRIAKVVFAHCPDTDQITVIFDDITKQREMEQTLIRKEKSKVLDTLVGGIAHELNNKLSPVLGFLSLHESTKGEGVDLNVFAPMMTEVTEEAAGIIRQLLELSRPAVARKERACLSDLLTKTVEFLSVEARRQNCELIFQSPDYEKLSPIEFDASQLRQVIVNLVFNAFHAVSSTEEKRVVMTLQEVEKEAVVSISDTGCGIPEAAASQVFDTFFTTKSSSEGSGLGLSVCRNIVEQHGGELDFVTQVDRGTTFSLRLPISESDEQPTSEVTVTAPPAIDLPEGHLRVLVVDDEPYVAEVVSRALKRKLGFESQSAASGAEAIERLQKMEDFDLIISDVRMPNGDGFALYHWIETNKPSLLKRFIFVTGDAGGSAFEDRLRFLRRPIVRKPFLIDELSAVCQSVFLPS
ncbi:ATP-binding protein [Verrucomicrobiales bacterium BCK34]|nr:ATP-binding protein [Verrucomicrobiales bacterium BCK34]